ncbi:hypothetical protein BS50DRAFT_416315 [Corynespora cassiicola Philippines]|uniref:Uncharacterized protein n=1 Tax=Corynespora cassiicola Philippines TaxID=1448308 RepID=A0A2T2NM50_CORCC|nr:hypothetical protein BS50DRAFT_416315 [Corynespora cassiicola Philippines]
MRPVPDLRTEPKPGPRPNRIVAVRREERGATGQNCRAGEAMERWNDGTMERPSEGLSTFPIALSCSVPMYYCHGVLSRRIYSLIPHTHTHTPVSPTSPPPPSPLQQQQHERVMGTTFFADLEGKKRGQQTLKISKLPLSSLPSLRQRDRRKTWSAPALQNRYHTPFTPHLRRCSEP